MLNGEWRKLGCRAQSGYGERTRVRRGPGGMSPRENGRGLGQVSLEGLQTSDPIEVSDAPCAVDRSLGCHGRLKRVVGTVHDFEKVGTEMFPRLFA